MLKFKLGKKKSADALPAEVEGETVQDVEGEGGAKKKPPLLLIIIGAAVLVAGAGGGAAFFLLKPKAPAAEGEVEHAAPKEEKKKDDGHGGGGDAAPTEGAGTIAAGPDGVTFYTLPDLIVNIQSAEGRTSYLKLKLTLEMKDAAVASTLQAQAPRLNDMMQSFLRELRPDDLAGSAGSYQLRAELLRRVNLVAAPGKVDAVLIEEMLVQ
ncbi:MULTISPECIES: flagellar basal body-associated FliL family protein [unclassified Brevundimonas]|uniref:flagellar basal body-associated FliL family protein n=1 Tax=unclassified Brevundimonas TaxID=2622653 RepID=UPI0025C6D2AF|nr:MULTISPECIES: flagellar basal body-associated FliL family protein [unclassified Brevundimonas]